MPNWVTNKIKIYGKEQDIAELINSALVNCGLEPKDNAEDGLKELVKNGMPSITLYKPIYNPEEKRVAFSTFLPIPRTFLEYDTTNYPEKYPEICAKQREEYGVVGWYDYNIKAFGCKWDSELEDMKLQQYNDDLYELSFNVNTPWSPPFEFLKRLKEKFPKLRYFISCVEEMFSFVGFVEIGGEEVVINMDDVIDARKESEDDDVVDIAYQYLDDDFVSEFENFIYNKL